MYEAGIYWGIVSVTLCKQGSYNHVGCLGISNKSVAVPDSMSPVLQHIHTRMITSLKLILYYNIHSVEESLRSKYSFVTSGDGYVGIIVHCIVYTTTYKLQHI